LGSSVKGELRIQEILRVRLTREPGDSYITVSGSSATLMFIEEINIS